MTDSTDRLYSMRVTGGMVGLRLGAIHEYKNPVLAQILIEKLMLEYGKLNIIYDMIEDLKNKKEELELSSDEIEIQLKELNDEKDN